MPARSPWARRWVDSTPRSPSALAGAGGEEHRAGPVAEQDAGAAVLPVEDAGIDLAADHQHAAWPGPSRIIASATDKRIDEPGARGREVEAEAPGHAERRLDVQRGRGKGLIRRRGREDDRRPRPRAPRRRRAARRGRPRRPCRRRSRARRRNGAGGCRCVRGSTRPTSRAVPARLVVLHHAVGKIAADAGEMLRICMFDLPSVRLLGGGETRTVAAVPWQAPGRSAGRGSARPSWPAPRGCGR